MRDVISTGRIASFVLVAVFAASCGGGDGGEPVDLAGTWSMTVTPTHGNCSTVTQELAVDIAATGDGYEPALGTPPSGTSYEAAFTWNEETCDTDGVDCFASIAVSQVDASTNTLLSVAAYVRPDRAIDGEVNYLVLGTGACEQAFDMVGQIE